MLHPRIPEPLATAPLLSDEDRERLGIREELPPNLSLAELARRAEEAEKQ